MPLTPLDLVIPHHAALGTGPPVMECAVTAGSVHVTSGTGLVVAVWQTAAVGDTGGTSTVTLFIWNT